MIVMIMEILQSKRSGVKKVWEITGPATEYPLNCQRRNGQIVNIRPVSWMSEKSKLKPFSCKEEFLAALYKTHLSYTNQTRVSREWLKNIIDGYKAIKGEDIDRVLSHLCKNEGITILRVGNTFVLF